MGKYIIHIFFWLTIRPQPVSSQPRWTCWWMIVSDSLHYYCSVSPWGINVFAVFVQQGEGGGGYSAGTAWRQRNTVLSWKHLAHYCRRYEGKIILKNWKRWCDVYRSAYLTCVKYHFVFTIGLHNYLYPKYQPGFPVTASNEAQREFNQEDPLYILSFTYFHLTMLTSITLSWLNSTSSDVCRTFETNNVS